MSKKEENQWEEMNDLIAKAGSNVNILEEEVDLKVQKEYFKLLETLSKEPDDYPEICKQYIENVNDLFDVTIDEDMKKRMLVVLATIEDVSIYRTIENFSQQDTPLQKWAVIALQQSRILLHSTLMDDPGVFISTGLGGQGLLLRYFGVFLNRENNKLQKFEQKIVRNEIEIAIKPFNGVIEQANFTEFYTTIVLLLPIDIDLKTLFERIIDECNQYGNFLHENMIITNVKKLSDSEIFDILKGKK